jgi:hypothetical protein
VVFLAAGTVALSVGCGGRLLELESAERGRDASAEGGAGDDGGLEAALGDDAGDACANLPAPQCTITATCGAMYLQRGEGYDQGYFNFETAFVQCPALPTIVQQRINGGWKQLASLAAGPYMPSPNTYILGSQFPLSLPEQGTTIGSVQSLRACTLSPNGCLTCDPPQSITVLSCGACPPIDCGPMRFLDEDCACVNCPWC